MPLLWISKLPVSRQSGNGPQFSLGRTPPKSVWGVGVGSNSESHLILDSTVAFVLWRRSGSWETVASGCS